MQHFILKTMHYLSKVQISLGFLELWCQSGHPRKQDTASVLEASMQRVETGVGRCVRFCPLFEVVSC